MCDKVAYPAWVAVVGNICSILAFTFLAPLPFVSDTRATISAMNICTAVQGIGVALTNVSAFTRAQTAAQRIGFNQDLKTYIMISGKKTCKRACPLQKIIDEGGVIWHPFLIKSFQLCHIKNLNGQIIAFVDVRENYHFHSRFLCLFVLGLFASALFLGNFLGPTLAGFLVENMDFPRTTAVSSVKIGVITKNKYN